MRLVRRMRWSRVLLVAPLLAFAVAVSSQVAVRCTMTGLVMLQSCCPAGTPAQPAATVAQSSVGDPGCCERVTLSTDKLPATGAEEGAAIQVDAHAVVAPVAIIARAAPVGLAARVHRPTRRRGAPPPFYVVTHAFLI